jgi:hypothetical protein
VPTAQPELADLQTVPLWNETFVLKEECLHYLSRAREVEAQMLQDINWVGLSSYLTSAALLVVAVEVVRLHRAGKSRRSEPPGNWSEITAPSGLV